MTRTTDLNGIAALRQVRSHGLHQQDIRQATHTPSSPDAISSDVREMR